MQSKRNVLQREYSHNNNFKIGILTSHSGEFSHLLLTQVIIAGIEGIPITRFN